MLLSSSPRSAVRHLYVWCFIFIFREIIQLDCCEASKWIPIMTHKRMYTQTQSIYKNITKEVNLKKVKIYRKAQTQTILKEVCTNKKE